MAIDTSFPDWLMPKQTPWQSLALGAQVGAQIAQARYRNQALKVQVEQQAQQDVLQMRRLALQEQQQTVMNQARLNEMEEAAAATRDAPRLAHFMKTGELNEPLESPRSYPHLAQIELAKSRSEVGRIKAADETYFNKRVAKIDPRDRIAIDDMIEDGAPKSAVWDALGAAEERQRAKLQSEKTFAPSPIRKLLDEANDAEVSGNMDEAETLRKRARTLSDGGRGATIDPSKMSDADRFRAGVLRTRLAAISATISNPLKREELGAVGAKEMTAERDTLTQDLEDILKKYSSATPAPGAAPATPPTSAPDPLGIR